MNLGWNITESTVVGHPVKYIAFSWIDPAGKVRYIEMRGDEDADFAAIGLDKFSRAIEQAQREARSSTQFRKRRQILRKDWNH